jgi:hypothetical protein
VIAHGKRIEIEDLDDPLHVKAQAIKRAKRRKEAFVVLPLEWAVDTAKAAKTSGAIVWILLCYTAWKQKSVSFPLTSVALASFGVGRETKRRVLEKLEAAGRIKVERRATRAPIITLLVPPETVP